MNYKEYKINGTAIIEMLEPGVIINDIQDFLDIVSDVCTKKIIVQKENVCDSFYDLRTGFAGDLLKKARAYKMHLGIVGDFSAIENPGFRDFMYESNDGKQIVFKGSTEEILKIFCRK